LSRRFAIVVVALLVAGCNMGSPEEDATGEEIYVQLCARCHSADLSGGIGPALGPGTNAALEDDEYLEFTILNGRGSMPSFASLDPAQLDRLVAYMREVQGE